jgi:hypothetical protein
MWHKTIDMASRRLKLLGESKTGISLEGRSQTIVKVEGFKGIFSSFIP